MDADDARAAVEAQHDQPIDRVKDPDAPVPAGLEGEADPPPGGYGDRDPKTEMPRVPTAPETQEDPGTHEGAPKTGKPRPAHG